MKKLLLFILICGYQKSYSQTSQQTNGLTSTPEQQIQNIVQNLSMSEVSSGLLINRGFPFTDVDLYDGVTLANNNKVSLNIWQALYATFYTSAISNQYRLPDISISTPLSHAYTL